MECQPGYTHSEWELQKEEHKYEGTWVVADKHYQRTRTDLCTQEAKQETKVEGPFQLWPATPPMYTADVNKPSGGTEVSGSPLRSTEAWGGKFTAVPDVQVGPRERVYGTDDTKSAETKVGHQSEPKPSPFIPALALLAGALIYFLLYPRQPRGGQAQVSGQNQAHGLAGGARGGRLGEPVAEPGIWQRLRWWASDQEEALLDRVHGWGEWLQHEGLPWAEYYAAEGALYLLHSPTT